MAKVFRSLQGTILLITVIFAPCSARSTTTPDMFPAVAYTTYDSALVQEENATRHGNGTIAASDANCEDMLEAIPHGATAVVLIILIIVVFVTIFGNILVIIAVLTFHELQTITNMFVGSLACADLIMGAVVLPLGIPYVITGRWSLGKLSCELWTSVDVLTVTASIETLCAIAIDRYFAITKPFTYTTKVTRTRARCIIALIWITSASIAFIPIQLGWWKETKECAEWCYANDECCEFMANQMYAGLSSSVSFYIPLFIMTFSYAIVFKEAIRHAAQIDDQNGMFRRYSMPGTNRPLWNRQQRRTLFTMGYIMGIFTVCWLPFFIVNLIQAYCTTCNINSSLFKTLNWLGYANSFFNPFIYSHNVQFRRAFVRLLTCLPCSEGLDRTKRASLSTSFPRYRESQRDSHLSMLTQFFTARKKSRRSAASANGMLKRDSTLSSGTYRLSPSRSPRRQPRFRLGSEDYDLHGADRLLNNNEAQISNGCMKTCPRSPGGRSVGFACDNRSDSSYDSAPSATDSSQNNNTNATEAEIVPTYVYERVRSSDAPANDESDEIIDAKSFYPSRRYSDLGSNFYGLRDAVSIKDVLKQINSSPNYVAVPDDDATDVTSSKNGKSKRSKSLFPDFSSEITEETDCPPEDSGIDLAGEGKLG